MPGIVYILCAVTSLICSLMLLRGFASSGVRLLLWSGLCFAGLAIENVILYVDVIIIPDVDISLIRRIPGLIAMLLLLYGLVWDAK
jgi:hypothetical protein